MIYESLIQQRGPVSLPEVRGERIYMLPFTRSAGLPESASRWQATVDEMLDGIPDTGGPAYLMVDESFVQAGSPHRRPGVHIDGYWQPGGRWGHRASAHGPGRHTPSPGPSHRPWQPGHKPLGASWETSPFETPEAIIMASSIEGACGYAGTYAGPVGDMGDCSGLDLSGLKRVPFPAHKAIACNVTGLHESLPLAQSGWRQLVRLNVPGALIQ